MTAPIRDALLLCAGLLTLAAVARSFARSLRRDGGRHFGLGSGSVFDAFTTRYGSWLFGAVVALAISDHLLRSPAFPADLQDIASALFLAFCSLLMWTDRRLANHFDHYHADTPALMTVGPYAWLRHPRYACWIGLLVTLTVALCSAVGLLDALAFVPLVVRRVRLEERFLLALYGNRYADYALQTDRLVPGLW